MALTEDTPEADSAEMWQWKHDQLREQYEALVTRVKDLERANANLSNTIAEKKDIMDRLTGRMTVKALRDAGIAVTITVPEPWDDCGCCD